MSGKARSFTFTHNNYLDTKLEDELDCKYIIYGREVGKECGTPHLQGFVSFSNQRHITAVRKLMLGCHVEIARHPDKAIEYCKKEGNFTERGTFATKEDQGQMGKQVWTSIISHTKSGDVAWVEENYPAVFVSHYNKLKSIYADAIRSRSLDDTEEQHLWFYGESGTGKSRKARSDYPDAYLKSADTKWWDGYVDQEHVLIEDFDKYHIKQSYALKIWADRYPFPAEQKGVGQIVIRPKVIIVTSNWHPNEIWENPQDLQPILRRFKCVYFANLSSSSH